MSTGRRMAEARRLRKKYGGSWREPQALPSDLVRKVENLPKPGETLAQYIKRTGIEPIPAVSEEDLARPPAPQSESVYRYSISRLEKWLESDR